MQTVWCENPNHSPYDHLPNPECVAPKTLGQVPA